MGAAGCGGHRPRPAALRVQRADLVQLAHTLQRLHTPTAAEVAAARTAWPSLAGGLPANATSALRVEVTAADRHAAALTLPAEVTTEGSVTGPAAELAGMVKSYVRLTQRGWQYLATALAAASSTGSSTTATHPATHHRQPAPGTTGERRTHDGRRGCGGGHGEQRGRRSDRAIPTCECAAVHLLRIRRPLPPVPDWQGAAERLPETGGRLCVRRLADAEPSRSLHSSKWCQLSFLAG